MRTIKIMLLSAIGILFVVWVVFGIYAKKFLEKREKNEEKIISSREGQK